MNITCGDLVMVQKDEVMPADMILLSTSNLDGSAFMETSNLDGEKNLKPRNCLHETFCGIGVLDRKVLSKTIADNEIEYNGGVSSRMITTKPKYKKKRVAPHSRRLSHDFHAGFDIELCCNLYIEEPNSNLYNFEGFVKFVENDIEMPRNVSLDVKNFLFKGARLRNTDFILGVVIYTGKETKVQSNSGHPRIKRTRLRGRLDMTILIIFMLQIVIAMVCTFGSDIITALGDGNFTQWLVDNEMMEENEKLLIFLRYVVI